jgi:AcrR family transcriptional regulator
MQLMTMRGAYEATRPEPIATDRALRGDAARDRQRVLTAAAQVFGERGLATSLDEVARAAGVGVGTVYRRFPSQERSVDARFEDKVEFMVVLADEAATFDDPWEGFAYFIKGALEWQVENRGLRCVLVRSELPRAAAATTRDTVAPILTAIVERVQVTGKLRPDVVVSDVLMLVTMLVAVFDYVDLHDPELGPRSMALMLDALVSHRAAWTRLPSPPVQALPA